MIEKGILEKFFNINLSSLIPISSDFTFKNFFSDEIESFQNKIEQVGQKLIGSNSRNKNMF